MRTSITGGTGAIKSLKNKGQILGRYTDTLILEVNFDNPVIFFQANFDRCTAAGIFDCVVQKYQKELTQKCLVAQIRNVRLEFARKRNVFGFCPRFNKCARLFQHLVKIKWLPDQTQLPCIRDRKREQSFDNVRELLELFIKLAKGLTIFFRAPGL